MRVQLVMKRICTEEEWKEFKEDIWYDYKKDNNFDELKEAELLNVRLDTLTKIDPFVGKYVSVAWVRKNVLQQTDEDMEEINAQMEQENAIVAQQQQQQMIAQQQADAQAQQDNMALQAQQQFQQAAVQDKIEKTFGNDEKEMVNKDHEANMMDKRIELEKVKASKKPGSIKTTLSKKKKTVSEEAKDLGLVYIGSGKYMNESGEYTHMNVNGVLVETTK